VPRRDGRPARRRNDTPAFTGCTSPGQRAAAADASVREQPPRGPRSRLLDHRPRGNVDGVGVARQPGNQPGAKPQTPAITALISFRPRKPPRARQKLSTHPLTSPDPSWMTQDVSSARIGQSVGRRSEHWNSSQGAHLWAIDSTLRGGSLGRRAVAADRRRAATSGGQSAGRPEVATEQSACHAPPGIAPAAFLSTRVLR